MVFLLIGGSKSGKSLLAQYIARDLAADQNGQLYYFATMTPLDDEDRRRVEEHKKIREGWGFATIEEPFDLLKHSNNFNHSDTILLDSLTAYVQNILFSDNDEVNIIGKEDLPLHVKALAKEAGNLIIVSDYIFSDAESFTYEVNRYKELLGYLNIVIAEFADCVIECVSTNVKIHKNIYSLDLSKTIDDFHAQGFGSEIVEI
ncbi:MAG: bifunctional adenosylcobinamide kinase/adenosylcobinamide-phosphate guanylyltransferase [Eubacteriaceae bacterium]|nr:bifunctional adenosylcobinamide kinase/adenosylcobinamide-phosphate guanylyltransferase [Eubacteriaceae bacterium]